VIANGKKPKGRLRVHIDREDALKYLGNELLLGKQVTA
jgi:hypothetical protein